MARYASLRSALLLRGAVVALLVLGVGAREARPSDASEEALERAILGLSSREEGARLAALGQVDSVLRAHGALVPRTLPRLREVLRTRGPREQARVVSLLARLTDSDATRLWLSHLDPSLDDRVIAAAVEGAAERAKDFDIERRLLEVARGDPSSLRRALAIEALGAFTGPGARLMLSHPRATWVEESCRALGLARWKSDEAVPLLVAMLGHADPAPRAHAWEALVTRTGKNLPPTKAAWEAPPTAAAPATVGDRYAAPLPAHVPTYYGIRIDRPQSRVVFCLDVSQSMWGGGIEQARKELSRTLKSLPSAYAFEVVAFNEEVMPWARRLVRAHPVQKARAIDWLMALHTVSYTNLFDAVETAFGHGGRGIRPAQETTRLDAVFLLSDGAPNRGRLRRHDEVVQGIAELSRKSIPVHTIGAGEEVFPLLRRIAAATGGTFADAFEFD